MKKLLITGITLAITAGGYFLWRSYTHKSQQCCESSCEEGAAGKTGSYSFKMSMVCEHSCAAKDVDKSKIVLQSKAKVGDFTQCPVSGVVFLVTDESQHVKNGNKTAYTCCATCAELFTEAPGDYEGNIN